MSRPCAAILKGYVLTVVVPGFTLSENNRGLVLLLSRVSFQNGGTRAIQPQEIANKTCATLLIVQHFYSSCRRNEELWDKAEKRQSYCTKMHHNFECLQFLTFSANKVQFDWPFPKNKALFLKNASQKTFNI